ncbi:MAG: hypothetical protein HC913_03675 [Microscillaceae bacterium]|nr:hypothetical protein [Microscillaceae bacterium]
MKHAFYLFLLSGLLTPSLQAQTTIPIQARPLIDLLLSVKENDMEKFRNAFSRKIIQANPPTTWNQNLREGREVLLSKFGNFRVEDFSFSYQGNQEEGRIVLYYQQQAHLSLAVVREQEGWKLNEH